MSVADASTRLILTIQRVKEVSKQKHMKLHKQGCNPAVRCHLEMVGPATGPAPVMRFMYERAEEEKMGTGGLERDRKCM